MEMHRNKKLTKVLTLPNSTVYETKKQKKVQTGILL